MYEITTAAFNESPLIAIGDLRVRAAAILTVQPIGARKLAVRLTDGTERIAYGATLEDFDRIKRSDTQEVTP